MGINQTCTTARRHCFLKTQLWNIKAETLVEYKPRWKKKKTLATNTKSTPLERDEEDSDDGDIFYNAEIGPILSMYIIYYLCNVFLVEVNRHIFHRWLIFDRLQIVSNNANIISVDTWHLYTDIAKLPAFTSSVIKFCLRKSVINPSRILLRLIYGECCCVVCVINRGHFYGRNS